MHDPEDSVAAQASIPKCILRRVASQGQGRIVDVQRWADEHRGSLHQLGVDVEGVPTSPEHADRAKTGQEVRLGRNGLLTDVMVWTSGECEVLYGENLAAVSVEQRSVQSQEDPDALMGELLARLYLSSRDER